MPVCMYARERREREEREEREESRCTVPMHMRITNVDLSLSRHSQHLRELCVLVVSFAHHHLSSHTFIFHPPHILLLLSLFSPLNQQSPCSSSSFHTILHCICVCLHQGSASTHTTTSASSVSMAPGQRRTRRVLTRTRANECER